MGPSTPGFEAAWAQIYAVVQRKKNSVLRTFAEEVRENAAHPLNRDSDELLDMFLAEILRNSGEISWLSA